jgi:hypothetical protein
MPPFLRWKPLQVVAPRGVVSFAMSNHRLIELRSAAGVHTTPFEQALERTWVLATSANQDFDRFGMMLLPSKLLVYKDLLGFYRGEPLDLGDRRLERGSVVRIAAIPPATEQARQDDPQLHRLAE